MINTVNLNENLIIVNDHKYNGLLGSENVITAFKSGEDIKSQRI